MCFWEEKASNMIGWAFLLRNTVQKPGFCFQRLQHLTNKAVSSMPASRSSAEAWKICMVLQILLQGALVLFPLIMVATPGIYSGDSYENDMDTNLGGKLSFCANLPTKVDHQSFTECCFHKIREVKN